MPDNPDLRLYVIQEGKSCLVYDWFVLEAGRLTGEDDPTLSPDANVARAMAAVDEALGHRGSWREVWLKPANGRNRREIATKCRVPDAERGFVFDPLLEQSARMATMVEKWNGFPVAPSMAAYDEMHGALIDALDAAILAHLYPTAVADKDFIAAWKGKLPA